jgi:hypothetical protein
MEVSQNAIINLSIHEALSLQCSRGEKRASGFIYFPFSFFLSPCGISGRAGEMRFSFLARAERNSWALEEREQSAQHKTKAISGIFCTPASVVSVVLNVDLCVARAIVEMNDSGKMHQLLMQESKRGARTAQDSLSA